MPVLTVPEPPAPPVITQEPVESRKHPLVSWMPLPRVFVALLVCSMLPPVMVRPFEDAKLNADIPPLNVELAVEVEIMLKMVEVPYAVMGPAMVVEPCTERVEPGVEVPMPKKLLVVSTERKLAELTEFALSE